MAWADVKELGQRHTVAAVVLAVLLWELLLRKLVKKACTSVFGQRIKHQHQSREDFERLAAVPGLQLPTEPHMEIALDPPCGLHHSNPKELHQFENAIMEGTYLFFHPPTGPETANGPDDMDYGEYFQGKLRLWEIRFQFRFKKKPDNDRDIFFGIELEEYVPLNMATLQAQRVITAGISQAIGGLYQSPGDDPRKVAGELEMPTCVLPLWAFDQFIETPENEEPPGLCDPNFPQLGKKRYRRIAEYAQEIKDLQQSFRAGPTYTMSFWGISRFMDVLNWTVIGIPIVTPMNFNTFAGKPPVHVVFYSLARADESGEKRHVSSRKAYLFKAAVWSSCKRPPFERMQELAGLSLESSLDNSKKKKRSLHHRISGYIQKQLKPMDPRAFSWNSCGGRHSD